jgi:dipeptidyl aminopeptidase/acylaminoacyl peptidase
MDADGGGQRVIPFPPDANWMSKNFRTGLISPSGKWMAYLSGSAGKCMGNGTDSTNDLTLKLFNLSNGETRVVTRLLSADYPNNFAAAAQQLGDPKITAAELQNTFVCGMSAASAWSPDGNKLAFAGQMAGLSSDLYVYDLRDGSIKQMSSGPEEILSIQWTSDGQWILTSSTFVYGAGVHGTPYRTKADGSVVMEVTENLAPLPGSGFWLNDHQYYRCKSTFGMGTYDLQVVDLKAQVTVDVWKGYFSALAFNPGKNWMAFYGTSVSSRPADDAPGFIPGIYLVNLTTFQQTRFEMPAVPDVSIYSILALQTSRREQFLLKASGADQEVFTLSTDGTLKSTGFRTADFLYQSPDKAEWLAFGKQLQVISAEGVLLHSVDLPAHLNAGHIYSIAWRPDQTGLFFGYSPMVGEVSGLEGVYAVDFVTEKVKKVDPSFIAALYFGDAMWVGGPK